MSMLVMMHREENTSLFDRISRYLDKENRWFRQC